jgi:hypothetical protein
LQKGGKPHLPASREERNHEDHGYEACLNPHGNCLFRDCG